MGTKQAQVKPWYYASINLVGIHGPIRTYPSKYGNGDWYDKSGNWGGTPKQGTSGDNGYRCYWSQDRKEVAIWVRGARALAARLRETL